MGLGDWGHTTKYGTHFDGIGSTIISCKNNDVEFVRKWYYYRNHIIGNCGSYNRANSFFILDEKTCQVQVFERKEHWGKSISKAGLKPFFWTRWYRDHTDIRLFVMLTIWYITIPIFLLVGLLFYAISKVFVKVFNLPAYSCLLYTSPSPRDATLSRMPSSA